MKRLVAEWADAVAENYAPQAMKGFGLDYDALGAVKPDLVMISACLNGQTGPHKDYPGFGGQGSALGGYNALTGWPDREPVGPYGTITDSLAPRFVAAALAAGLLYRRRTGRGVYLDISQVESAQLVAVAVAARLRGRRRDPPARRQPPPARVPARRVPVRRRGRRSATAGSRSRAGRTTNGALARVLGLDDDPARDVRRAQAREDEVEALAAWTATRTRAEVAEELQAAGIEAVPVKDFGDLHDDPQVARRKHFVAQHAPVPRATASTSATGSASSDAPGGYDRPGRRSARTTNGCCGTCCAWQNPRARSGAVERRPGREELRRPA